MPEHPAQSIEVLDASGGRCRLSGALTFATARRTRELGIPLLEQARSTALLVDCEAVTAADSAGLAVLVDWLAIGARYGCRVSFFNLPATLKALAHISEVESFLNQGVMISATPHA